MGLPFEFLFLQTRSQNLIRKFLYLILALFIIFISSVGSKCLKIFYKKITGKKDSIENPKENPKIFKEKLDSPKNPPKKNRQIK